MKRIWNSIIIGWAVIIGWVKGETKETAETIKAKQQAAKSLLSLWVLDVFSAGKELDDQAKQVLADTKARILAGLEGADKKVKADIQILLSTLSLLDTKGKTEIKHLIDSLKADEQQAKEQSWNRIKAGAQYFTTIQDVIKLRNEVLAKMDELGPEFMEEEQHLLDELFVFEGTIKDAAKKELGSLEFEAWEGKFKAEFGVLAGKWAEFLGRTEGVGKAENVIDVDKVGA